MCDPYLSVLSLAFVVLQKTSGFPDLINRVLQQVPWWKRPFYPLQAFSAIKVLPSGTFQQMCLNNLLASQRLLVP
jgi:hypothetical protein